MSYADRIRNTTSIYYNSDWVRSLEKDIECNARAGLRHFGLEVPRASFRALRKRLYTYFDGVKIDTKHIDKYMTHLTIRW